MMKKRYQWMTYTSLLLSILFVGCHKQSKEGGVWGNQEDAVSYKDKKGSGLWGNSEELSHNDGLIGPNEEDFIPLREEDLKVGFGDGAIPQSRETPGEPGSRLPGMERFEDPSGDLSAIFRTLYFNTDDHVLRSKESLQTLDRIAAHLKSHPKTYIFIAGHCDERGPEAYNLSLGARRANYVRSMLIQRGVDLDHIHTISYGKEKPQVLGHDPDAWARNRRAQFKVYSQPR
jgi:peptidoglycan-associated lipoprotein